MRHRRWRRVRRALTFIHPARGAVAGILLLAAAVAAFNALEPLALKAIFDELAGRRLPVALLKAIAALVLLGVLREAASGLSNWLTWRTRLKVHYDLLEATVGRLHSLPVSYHRTEGVGAVMTRLDRGIQGFVGALSEITFNVVPAIGYHTLALIIMLRLDWRLALTVIAFAPLPGFIAGWAAPAQTRRERGLLERWVRIYSRFNEVLSGIVTVKSFAMEEAEKSRFLSQVNEANQVVTRGVGFDSGVGVAQNMVVMTARVAAIAFGSVLVVRGEVSVGTLVAFLGYVGGLFGPVQGLSSIYKTLHTASVSLDEVFSILDASDSLADQPNAIELPPVRGQVELRNVSFAYQSGNLLLDDVSLTVQPGENVAIVGPSGSGKTTLMSLLQRFHDPTSGAVLVDGIDVRHLKQHSLRRQIGVVLQDALLFNETVRDNIAYGRPGATKAEIEAAARAANAHDFIERLPEGYDTIVGERGNRLSSGERQRIAIARAIVKDPPVLILDEPTSALDSESESLVQEALNRLMKGRTTFSIAHRLSTVVDATRILVLRRGRIVEHGSHGQLMAMDGYYASLVRRQTRGLIHQRAA